MAIAALWDALTTAGLTETRRLATLLDDEVDTVRAAMGTGRDDEDELVAILKEWAEDAQGAAKRRHEVRARESLQGALWASAQAQREKRRASELEAGAERVIGRPPPPPAAKWPTRAARKMAAATSPHARAEVEQGEVNRWADRAI